MLIRGTIWFCNCLEGTCRQYYLFLLSNYVVPFRRVIMMIKREEIPRRYDGYCRIYCRLRTDIGYRFTFSGGDKSVNYNL